MSLRQFIFSPEKGETPESLKRNRAVADALFARSTQGAPRNVGEGLSAVGQALMYRMADGRARKSEEARDAEQAEIWKDFKTGGGGASLFGPGMLSAPGDASASAPFSGGSFTPPSPSSPAGGARAAAGGPSSSALPASFLATVDRTEGGGDYDTLFGHAQRDGGQFGGTRITEMPISEVLAFADPKGSYGQWVKGQVGRVATPMGRHQIVGSTLRRAVNELGIDPSTPFSRDTQDTVAAHLARGRLSGQSTTGGKIAALRSEWEGFKHVSDSEMAQIVADLESGGGMPAQAAQQPVQVASLDPSIGMASASSKNAAVGQALGLAPTTQPARLSPAAAALNGVAPGNQPAPQPQRAAPQQAQPQPVQQQRAPQPQQAPVQYAQAQPSGGGMDPQALVSILSNPWASDDQRRLAQMFLQQGIAQQQAMQERAFETQQQQREWAREDARFAVTDQRENARLGMEMQQFERDSSKPIEVGGVLLDPNTMQPVYQPPAEPFTLNSGQTRFDGDGRQIAAGAPETGFRVASPQEAGSYGAAGGQFGPDGRFYPIDPPSGGITVGPDGTVQIGGPSGGGKVPTNFEPDPNNPGGVRPIAGGPGEQLPAEFAGRVGMSDSFLGQAPALREQLAAGGVTGPWDRLQAGFNSSSDQAELYRKLESGADTLQRLLTGAGMTESEAATYARRYLPTYSDDADSAVTKLDQMIREVENVRAAALRGRGGMGATITPNGPTGSPGTSLRDKYGLE